MSPAGWGVDGRQRYGDWCYSDVFRERSEVHAGKLACYGDKQICCHCSVPKQGKAKKGGSVNGFVQSMVTEKKLDEFTRNYPVPATIEIICQRSCDKFENNFSINLFISMKDKIVFDSLRRNYVRICTSSSRQWKKFRFLNSWKSNENKYFYNVI